MKLFVSSVLLILSSAYGVDSLNILGIFPYQGKSHFFVFEPYLQELAKRGHNVTVISHFPQKKPVGNYNDIDISGQVSILEDVFSIERSYMSIFKIVNFVVKTGTENCRQLMSHRNVQQLWRNSEKYDLVVVEQFNTDCSLGLAWKLGAPVIGLTSHVLMPWHYKRFGVPYNPSYVPFQFLEGGVQPTLYQRVERSLFDISFGIFYKYYGQAQDEKTISQYFDGMPPLEELARDIKFQLLYQNFILMGSRLFPSNVVEVGGYHVAKAKPLPTELQKYIEESEHGVIYVSFGSMLRASYTPKDKIESIISALSELPQRVIWKWEESILPGNPKNIYISNWLPQNDILAHPNVLAFYSHAGLLSTTEAIYHGVPMLAMPIFGDQPSNAAAVEESGLGVQIQVSELTRDTLLKKLKTILDVKFRKKVKLVSKAWHDRPISPMDSAIYWAEFAAKHSNFTFRTPAADVPLYQYLCLDVVLILSFLCILVMLVFKSVINILISTEISHKFKNE